MLPSISPANNNAPSAGHQPRDVNSSPTPYQASGSAVTMTEFMKLFNKEQKEKFEKILVQNIVAAINKASKKMVEELKKQREDIQRGG